MVSTLLGTDDACANTAGWGMQTSWTLNGSTTEYVGALADTDGYVVRASLAYKGTATYGVASTTISGETLTGLSTAYGTCVVSVDNAGTTQLTSSVSEGNQVMCHWLYILGGSVQSVQFVTGSDTVYGESRFMNGTEWGVDGSGIVGSNIKSLGTTLTAAEHGFILSPASLTLYTDRTYTMDWYQPKYASRYSSTGLKRYNGGATDGSKVRAYCMAQRLVSTTTVLSTSGIVAATNAGVSGVVTLSGASTLAASVIAFGAAALAF